MSARSVCSSTPVDVPYRREMLLQRLEVSELEPAQVARASELADEDLARFLDELAAPPRRARRRSPRPS